EQPGDRGLRGAFLHRLICNGGWTWFGGVFDARGVGVRAGAGASRKQDRSCAKYARQLRAQRFLFLKKPCRKNSNRKKPRAQRNINRGNLAWKEK
ncbi:MAG: hypothetical protein M3O82_03595, partial [Verrucomicrobiota bacterium]|nr:hypothetical protein [Verrucomicrobiota bacterium]